jgi:hypothetical protein
MAHSARVLLALWATAPMRAWGRYETPPDKSDLSGGVSGGDC